MRQRAKGWAAHLPVPDVGGQDLVLLVLGKERELAQVALWDVGPLCTHEPQKELLPCVPISLGSGGEAKSKEKGQQGKLVFY